MLSLIVHLAVIWFSATIFHVSFLFRCDTRCTGKDHRPRGSVREEGQHDQFNLHRGRARYSSEQRDLVPCRCCDRFRWSKVRRNLPNLYSLHLSFARKENQWFKGKAKYRGPQVSKMTQVAAKFCERKKRYVTIFLRSIGVAFLWKRRKVKMAPLANC